MSDRINEMGQAIGFAVDDWHAREHPRGASMQGRFCRLEAVSIETHSADLFEAFNRDLDHRNWTYLPYGPFASQAEFSDWMVSSCGGDDPCFFAVIELASGKAVGLASYLRIDPGNGVIEVGHIHFSPLMQNKPIATEAMYQMMRQVFDVLGYRRYEWKCDALNAPSCSAAKRLGFEFEGLFRQALIYKNRNRDTAWFSILEREWPAAKAVFEAWLSEDNFDARGRQKTSLSQQMKLAMAGVR